MPNSTQTTSKTPVKPLAKAPSTVAKKSVTKPTTTTTTTITTPVTKPPIKSPTTARKVVLASKKIATKTAGIKAGIEVTVVPAVKALIAKPIKAKKVKLVRDSFTIPKPEYLILDNLKLRAADLKHPAKKSELLRAGIKALAAMTDTQLLLALKAVPMLKTGRPSK
jgi:hypothetical protein